MIKYQTDMYNNLMKNVVDSEAFFFADRELDGLTYRIFNYRLASYTEFLRPSALECRGHMFELDNCGNPICLSSLPMEKFFNLNENPLTMDLDLSTVDMIELKADGSLISTYLHNGDLRLKTKGSIDSDQCVAAMAYLEQPKHAKFKSALTKLAIAQCTVNMEWCAPDNRIVLSYMEPELTVLNIRYNLTGDYYNAFDAAFDNHDTIETIRAHHIPRLKKLEPIKFVAGIPEMLNIEGYIVRLATGQRVKIKTLWYLVQHRAKDSINSDRRLYETVLAEATDDLRSLFHDDALVIKRIGTMEHFVEQKYNHLVDTVERYYERNNQLSQKEYAILGLQELDPQAFGLAMMKFNNKPFDYKEFMIKRWRDFGVTDLKNIQE
jgi:T4 RnlA family RNA ligase